MTLLWIGIVLFGGTHLYSIFLPGHRDGLRAAIGEKPYKGAYSLVSLIGLGFMIAGFLQSRSGPLAADWLYVPMDGARHITMLLVLAGFILASASHGKGYIKKWIRNPMSWGFVAWSTGHLLANGKRTDVYMFGMFLVIALADIVMSELRGKRPTHQPRVRSDVVAVIVGIILYAIFLFGFHPYVLNLPVTG